MLCCAFGDRQPQPDLVSRYQRTYVSLSTSPVPHQCSCSFIGASMLARYAQAPMSYKRTDRLPLYVCASTRWCLSCWGFLLSLAPLHLLQPQRRSVILRTWARSVVRNTRVPKHVEWNGPRQLSSLWIRGVLAVASASSPFH